MFGGLKKGFGYIFPRSDPEEREARVEKISNHLLVVALCVVFSQVGLSRIFFRQRVVFEPRLPQKTLTLLLYLISRTGTFQE